MSRVNMTLAKAIQSLVLNGFEITFGYIGDFQTITLIDTHNGDKIEHLDTFQDLIQFAKEQY